MPRFSVTHQSVRLPRPSATVVHGSRWSIPYPLHRPALADAVLDEVRQAGQQRRRVDEPDADAGRRAPDAKLVVMRDDRNVLGGELAPCGTDPVTGFYRDGCCSSGPEDLGSHTVCAVVTTEFLAHQRRVGNDLTTPRPEYRFPGLNPGDRWCVVAARWLQAYRDGVAAPMVLAATHARALDIVPLDVLREHAVDVPADPSSLV
jgi:uncharacterized protein (DUF2237 family)